MALKQRAPQFIHLVLFPTIDTRELIQPNSEPMLQFSDSTMDEISHFFSVIWNFRLSVIPVLITYFVFEISSIVRRATRIAYTPIYFSFFPLGHADELYARYFNEDDFFGVGPTQTPRQKNQLRKKIISISIISMIFSLIFNPSAAGIFSAIFLTKTQFTEFFVFLAIVKMLLVIYSLYNTRRVSFVYNTGAFGWLFIVYALYIAIILRITHKSFDWAADVISEGGIISMISKIFDLLIFDFGFYILLAAAIGAAISYWLTDPQNIPETLSMSEMGHNQE